MNSGFLSVQQETYYDKTVKKLIEVMAERLLQCQESHDIRWVKQLRKVVKATEYMECAKQGLKVVSPSLLNLSLQLKKHYVSSSPIHFGFKQL